MATHDGSGAAQVVCAEVVAADDAKVDPAADVEVVAAVGVTLMGVLGVVVVVGLAAVAAVTPVGGVRVAVA